MRLSAMLFVLLVASASLANMWPAPGPGRAGTAGGGGSPGTTSFRTAGTETDSGGCYTTITTHTVSDDARVEGFCLDSFRLSNFGFTDSDIPSGSTIDGITVQIEAHGGPASQGNRRRIDVWVVDEAGVDCETGGVPGWNNHQLNLDADLDVTWTNNEAVDVKWGCAWDSDADIKDIDFGFRWEHTSASGSNVIGIDYVAIQIEYTSP
jgi:hypothetical protein